MVWKCYRRLEKEGKLSVRAFLHHYVFNIDDMHYYLQNSDKRTGDGTGKVRVGAFKIFVDGTHRLHTAALEEPYHDDPKTRGTLLYEQDELNEMLRLAEENNMQVAMHCIGDRAVKTALNAIAQTENSMRHRIIHADTLSDALLQRLREVKPCIESQPGFLLDEWNNYAKWLGEKRGPYCGMAKSVIDTGSPVSLSSDAPIGPLNPFEHIFAAVNRTDWEGHPKGGWIPSEKLDFETAFKGYTAVPPYLEFAEDMKGTIKPGAKADFMLLEDYPTDCPTETLNEIKVQQTWMDGNKVYDRAFE
jgi:predicted amidohydrolase YtcJ